MPVRIDADLCVFCRRCVRDCAFSVLSEKNGRITVENESSCILCGHCEAVCPAGAIAVQKKSWSVHAFYRPDAPTVSPDALVRLTTERRSIRQFQKQMLDETTLRYLLEAARYSPTGINRQNLKYIVLQKTLPDVFARVIGELSSNREKYTSIIGQTVLERIVGLAEKDQDNLFFAAPVVIVILDKCGKLIDGALAASHIVLLAETMGLGTCINGIFPKIVSASASFSDILPVPDGYGIVTSIALGYPSVDYRRIPTRKPANVLWK